MDNKAVVDMAKGEIVFGKTLLVPLIRKKEYLGVARIATDQKIWGHTSREIQIRMGRRNFKGEVELTCLPGYKRGLKIHSKTCRLGREMTLVVRNESDKPIYLKQNGPIANCIRALSDRERSSKQETKGRGKNPEAEERNREHEAEERPETGKGIKNDHVS